MKTRENIKYKPNINESFDNEDNNYHFLILYNDNINSFDFVIETLVNVCKHDSSQAEQCAYITHYKGKCDIKKGPFDFLKPIKDELINKGLSATIE